MTDDDDFVPWTDTARNRLVAAGRALADAVLVHAAAVAAVTGEPIQPVLEASDALASAALTYSDAQFDYTGMSWPFGSLRQFIDDEDDEDEDDGLPTSGVSVLSRYDYAVVDEEAVMAAGRAAYAAVWPEDSPEAAAADVSHLGRALYQIVHARGLGALDDTNGLRAMGSSARIHAQDSLLGRDPDDWPEDLFAMNSEPLHIDDGVPPFLDE